MSTLKNLMKELGHRSVYKVVVFYAVVGWVVIQVAAI